MEWDARLLGHKSSLLTLSVTNSQLYNARLCQTECSYAQPSCSLFWTQVLYAILYHITSTSYMLLHNTGMVLQQLPSRCRPSNATRGDTGLILCPPDPWPDPWWRNGRRGVPSWPWWCDTTSLGTGWTYHGFWTR